MPGLLGWLALGLVALAPATGAAPAASPVSAATAVQQGHPTIQGLALAYEELTLSVQDLALPGPSPNTQATPDAIVARLENVTSAADGAPPRTRMGPLPEAEQYTLIPLQLTFALELNRRNWALAHHINYFLAYKPRVLAVLRNELKNLEGAIADFPSFAPITAEPLRGITQAAVEGTNKAIEAFST